MMKIMETSFKRSHACTAAMSSTLQQATANPCLCQRLLDAHRQDWVSLLWHHCSFLQGPGVHKVFLLPSKSLLSSPTVTFGGLDLVHTLEHTSKDFSHRVMSNPWHCNRSYFLFSSSILSQRDKSPVIYISWVFPSLTIIFEAFSFFCYI